MRHRRTRRFRPRSNGRNHRVRDNVSDQVRLGPSLFSNGRNKNNHRNYQSAEKLVEKYNNLAKEALSSGDKILSENYFQHADHFSRIIKEKNLASNENRVQNNDAPAVVQKNSEVEEVKNNNQEPLKEEQN